MTLEFTVPQYPLKLGVDEGTDPRQVPPGTLLTAENVEWEKEGQLGKRDGTAALTTSILGGGSIAACSRLGVRGDELCMNSSGTLYSYSSALTSWRSGGSLPNVGLTWTTAIDPTSGAQAWDVAVSSAGVRVEAWVSQATGSTVGGPIFARVVEHSTGTVLMAPFRVTGTTSYGVRVLIIGTTAIFVTRQSTTNIFATTLNLSTMALVTAGNLRTDAAAIDGEEGWDACVIGSTFVIAYSTATPALVLYSYNTSLVQQATGGITGAASGAGAVSIDGASGEVLYVAYQDGAAAPSDVKIAIANPSTLAQTVAPVQIEVGPAGNKAFNLGVARFDASNCVVSYSIVDPAGTYSIYRTTSWKISSGAVVATLTPRYTWGVVATSKPFVVNGAAYLLMTDFLYSAYATESAPLDGTTFIGAIRTSNGTGIPDPHPVVGIVDQLIGGVRQATVMPIAGVATSGSNVAIQVPYQATVGAVQRTGLRLATVTPASAAPADYWRTVPVGGEMFMACGALTAYDGNSAFDYGFPRAPAFYQATPSNGAGSMALGTYLYAATREYRSANFLYRSRVGTANATLTGTDDTVSVIALGHGVGNKQNDTTGYGSGSATPELMPWYRTVVNGTVYQRLTAEPYANVNYPSQLTGTISFTDLRNDSDIGDGYGTDLSTRPALYTDGGILEDYAPPGCVTLFNHADRLFTLAGDRRTWWYSKAFQDDVGVAPGFHPDFRVIFDDEQTCGASMDDKAVFFSTAGLAYMTGTGPAPNGTGSDFQAPLQIQSDVGCSNARGVVGTPDGVMFDTGRGIYLLTRSLELVHIGRPVQDTLASFPNITSAVLVPGKRQVRFTANNAGNTAHAVLVFDYQEKQWTTFRYTHASVYGGGAIADAVMWNDTYTFAMSDGTVYTEDDSTHLDAGTAWVPLTLKTAWISAAGPLAFHSVRRFTMHGNAVTDHNLSVAVAFDGASASETHTFACPSAVTSAGSYDDPQVPIGTRRKCQTIQFTVTDATPTSGTVGTGAGPTFDMMGIEVGVKRGLSRQPATKKG